MATKTKKQITNHDRIDLDMVMGLIGNSLLSDQGIQQIKQLMSQAKDPTGVMAQLVFHAVSQVHDQLIAKGLKVSSKIWVARGGVVDQTIAEVAKLISSINNNPDIINQNILEQTRQQVIQLLQAQEAHHQSNSPQGEEAGETMPDNESGEPGMPPGAPQGAATMPSGPPQRSPAGLLAMSGG